MSFFLAYFRPSLVILLQLSGKCQKKSSYYVISLGHPCHKALPENSECTIQSELMLYGASSIPSFANLITQPIQYYNPSHTVELAIVDGPRCRPQSRQRLSPDAYSLYMITTSDSGDVFVRRKQTANIVFYSRTVFALQASR